MKKYLRFKFNRKPEYHLITEFYDEFVVKYPFNKEAERFYQNVLQHNLDFRDRKIPCVPIYNKLETKWIDGKILTDCYDLLSSFLNNNFKTSKVKEFDLILFDKNLGNFKFNSEVLVCHSCDMDLIAQNFILINDQILIIDLEWKVNMIPVDYLLWKSNPNKIKLEQEIEEVFIEIERVFQTEVLATKQIENFQFGKLSHISNALKEQRDESEHYLYLVKNQLLAPKLDVK